VAYGVLFLRVILGATMFAHGAQKLVGWFGGHGPRGTAGFFGSLGFRSPLLMATAAGLSEASGAALALGLLTPLAALAIASVMVVAVATIHGRNGFFNQDGGFEYNLLIWAAAIAIAAGGPGRFSVDGALGWAGSLSGLWWGVGVLGASLAGGIGVVAGLRGTPPDAEAADEPLAREAEQRERTRA
jgi:putative oxidoreductase